MALISKSPPCTNLPAPSSASKLSEGTLHHRRHPEDMIAKLVVASLACASALKVQPLDKALKLRGGGGLADVTVGTINLVNAVYYGGYGVPLVLDGDKFFGPDGMAPYQKKNIEGPVGKFFSRFVGVMFLALSSGYIFDKESKVLTKQFGLGSLGFIPLLITNAQDEANFNKPLWLLQHFIHIPLTIVTLLKGFKD